MAESKKTKTPERPPLTMLDTSDQMRRSIRMDNASDVSDLNQVSLFDFGESEFELMHVTVTIQTLSGLLSDKVADKKKGKKNPSESQETTATASTSSSSAPSCVDKQKVPTTAVASFGRNVCSSQTNILTHLPSLPLGAPTSSFGYVNRYMAHWYEPKPAFLREENEQEPESKFTFLRVMMREPVNLNEKQSSSNVSSYVHETIDINVNLSRGKEILPLGVATLVITGDEEGSVTMNLPAKPIFTKGKGGEKKIGKRLFNKKKVKRATFSSDPTRAYYLDENACLRVSVSIVPQETINDARAREHAKEIRRQMHLEKLETENNVVQQRAPKTPKSTRTKASAMTSTMHSFMGTTVTVGTEQPTVAIQPGIFCGCNALSNKTKGPRGTACLQKEVSKDYSVDTSTIDNIVQEKYGYSLASSVLSSVSGSESESDESSEDEDIHLNRKIIVRRKDRDEVF